MVFGAPLGLVWNGEIGSIQWESNKNEETKEEKMEIFTPVTDLSK